MVTSTFMLCLALASATTEARSANFVVRSSHTQVAAADVAKQCETVRSEAATRWHHSGKLPTWNPICEVVVHSSRGSYLATVGRGAEQTLGSSWIEFSGNRVSKRRIDLILDTEGKLSALPHELTHVILADLFGQQPPRWIDEGIATLADSSWKRQLHRRDSFAAAEAGTAFRLGELLNLESFTAAEQVPAFYGQSLSLVGYLAQLDEPPKLIRFAKQAMQRGYDQALRDCYGIDSLAQLEHQWLQAEQELKKQSESHRSNKVASDDFR